MSEKTYTYGSIPKSGNAVQAEQDLYNGGRDCVEYPPRSMSSRLPAGLRLGAALCVLATCLILLRPSEKTPVKRLVALEVPQSGSSYRQLFYEQQIDHFDSSKRTWSQRYYAKKRYWRGPGHPIFLIVGGEGALNPPGFFYGFVDRVMADKFGALTLHPEHRFYGISQPLQNASTAELLKLLTPEQAMRDMIEIANHYRKKLRCSLSKSSSRYCPVIPVGGSYPGFLAALMRIAYPDEVDMAYASSAPLKLYAQQGDPNGYFDVVTEVADKVSPGCAAATKQALVQVDEAIRATDNYESLAERKLAICPGSIPKYIDNSPLLSDELMQVIESTFADANMIGNYPPSNETWFASLCHVFQDNTKDSFGKVSEFWKHLEVHDDSVDCFQMDDQLSVGDDATISGADWSGSGPGMDGRMWDFQCCVSLIPALGFSDESMFPRRDWTYDWLTKHCVDRFGVVGDPLGSVNRWHFDDLVGEGASRIVFTSGGNDMWIAGSWTEELSDDLLAIVMPNGAHHSEVYARDDDTPDIKEGQKEIIEILGRWLEEIKKGTK